MEYKPPSQLSPCPFLAVREFELRAPDSDDLEEEIPVFPNALPICTAEQACCYQTMCFPQAWHPWDPQWVCCGFSVVYTGKGDELAWTVEPDLGGWWPGRSPLQPQPEPTFDEQLELIASQMITAEIRAEFPTWCRRWGYAGATAYVARQIANKRIGERWHWPEARSHKGTIEIWRVGHNYPAKPDATMPLIDFVKRFLMEPPPDGEQLRMF